MNDKLHQSHRLAILAVVGITFLLAQWVGFAAVTVTKSGGVTTVTESDAIAISDSNQPPTKASPYPSRITTSGLNGSIGGITVMLNNLRHDNPDDIDIVLRYDAPEIKDKDGNVTSQRVVRDILLMSDAGGTHPLDKINLTFKQGSSALPNFDPIASGTYRPTDHDVLDVLGTQEPTTDTFPDGPAVSNIGDGVGLNDLIGQRPNATWSLFVIDDAVTHAGSIASGWSIKLNLTPRINTVDGDNLVVTNEDTQITVDIPLADDDTDANNLKLSVEAIGGEILVSNAINDNGTPNNADDDFRTNLVLGGSGATRTLTIKPIGDRNSDGRDGADSPARGNQQILLTVDDGVSQRTRTINLRVDSVNDQPRLVHFLNEPDVDQDLNGDGDKNDNNIAITGLPNKSTNAGVAMGPQTFRVTDKETPNGNLTFEVASSNTGLVPTSNIFIFDDPNGTDPGDKLLFVSPEGSNTGTSDITVRVVDTYQAPPVGDNPETRHDKTAATFTLNVNQINSPIGANTDTITINNNVTEKNISISGGVGRVGRVMVTLADLHHTDPNSIIATLTSPDGTVVNLLNQEPIGDNDIGNTRLTFLDGAGALPNPITSGTFGTFAPDGSLADFVGENINGTWKLSISSAAGSGEVQGGAILTIRSAPTITAVGNKTTEEDKSFSFNFTIGDQDNAIKDLDVTVTSSLPALIPNAEANLKLEGDENSATRKLTVTPQANANSSDPNAAPNDPHGTNGPATVTIAVNDGVATTTETFTVTVTPVNDLPVFSAIQKQETTAGIPVEGVQFRVVDVETPSNQLVVVPSSSNVKLLPNENIDLVTGQYDANNNPLDAVPPTDGGVQLYTINLFPAGVQTGTSILTLKATDGNGAQGTQSFTLTVLAAENSLFVNANPITIPDNANANPFPSRITATGLIGPLRDVSVTLVNFNHQSPQDVLSTLVGPNGNQVTLLDANGGSDAAVNTQLILRDDNGADLPPIPAPLRSGAFNADEGPSAFTDEFRGSNPNGDWELRLQDTVQNNLSGSVDGGFNVNITTGPKANVVEDKFEFDEDSQKATIEFTVGDNQEASQDFDVVFEVAGANVIDPGDFELEANTVKDNKGMRRYKLNLNANQSGTATVTVRVSNPAPFPAQESTDTFTLQINAVNDAPVISGISDDVLDGISTQAATTTSPINLTVTDPDSDITTGRMSGTDSAGLVERFIFTRSAKNGAVHNFTVQIVPKGTVTGTTTVTLRASDGSLIDTETFTLNILSNQATFGTGSDIVINDPPGLGQASPYPAPITVKDILGTIRGIRVIFPKISHTFPQDLDIALEGPVVNNTRKRVMLMSDAIGNFSNPLNNNRIVFNDASNAQLPQTGGLAIGNEGPFQPTNYNDNTNDLMPNPAGGDPLNGSGFGLDLGVFINDNPNGEWRLLVNDDQTPDGGRLAGGWILVIETAPTVSFSLPLQDGDDPQGPNNPKVATSKEDQDFAVSVVVGDADTGPDNLTITVESSNAALFDAAAMVPVDPDDASKGMKPKNWVISGSGSNKTLTIKTEPNKHTNGNEPNGFVSPALVTIRVSDGTTEDTDVFRLSTSDANDAPTITSVNGDGDVVSGIQNAETNEDTPKAVPFTVGDLETAPGTLKVTVTNSSNPSLLPLTKDGDGNFTRIAFTNNGADRVITFSPASNQFGTTDITVQVTDLKLDGKDGLSTTATFTLTVKSVNDTPFTRYDTGNKDGDGNAIIKTNEIDPQAVELGDVKTVTFEVGDVESDPKDLTVTAVSGNTALIPNANIQTGGSGAIRTLTIAPAGVNAGAATITLRVSDGNTTREVQFVVNVGPTAGKVFANTTAIKIPNSGTSGRGGPYPSVIPVGGLVETRIHEVTVNLDNVNHEFADDIDLLLVGPFQGNDGNGNPIPRRNVVLMSDAGGNNPLSGQRLIFSDNANSSLPDSTRITGLSFKPTNHEGNNDAFPNNENDNTIANPNGPYGSTLSVFNGLNPNGNWSLFAIDDTGNHVGEITVGWSITIETLPTLTLNSGSVADGKRTFTMSEDAVGTFNLTVSDADSNNAELQIFATSSNQSLVRNSELVMDSQAAGARTLTITPRPNAFGEAEITVTVRGKNDNSRAVTAKFTLKVNNIQDPPTITRVSPRTTNEDTPLELLFTVDDVDGDTVTVTAISGNNALFKNNDDGVLPGLAVDPKPVLDFGTSYILTLNPVANANRVTTNTPNGVDITIRADDGKGNVVTASNPTPNVTVIEVNDAPMIGVLKDDTFNPIPDQSATAGQVINVNFNVDDLETADNDLTLTAASSNTSIIPVTNNITFPDNDGPTRSVRIPIPENAPVSTVTITLSVKDTAEGNSGAKSTSRQFLVDIRESTAVTYPSAGGLITINDNGAASQYPSTVTVPPVVGGIGRIEVQLTDLGHSFPGDLDILLVSPQGTPVLLMSDAGRGGSTVANPVDLLFRDGGDALPDNGQIVSGSFRPTNYDAGDGVDVLPAPAPAGPFGPEGLGGSLANFIGENPEGNWSLFVVDDTSADSGSLGGWSLLIETGPEINGLVNSVTIDEDQSFTTGFTVQDETDLRDITAVSDNQAVIPNSGLSASFDDKGNATLTITPGANAFGTAVVTVTVRDRDLHAATRNIAVTVNSVNDAPQITNVSTTPPIPFAGRVTNINFDLFDVETGFKELSDSLTFSSSDQKLVPDANISRTSTGLSVTPAGLSTGTTTITITIDDGSGAANSVATEKVELTFIDDPNPVFDNGGAVITINDNATASPYPSTIEVSGLSGNIADVSATLIGFNHNFPDDVDILLVAPNGSSVSLLSDAGGGNDVSNARITFRDDANSTLPDEGQIESGIFRPSNFEGADTYPGPAPAGPHGAALSNLSGNPNGTWSLFVRDSAQQDAGLISGGWILNIVTSAPNLVDLDDITLNERRNDVDPGASDTFAILDDATAGDDLVVTAVSDDDKLLPASALEITGTGNSRTLTVTPPIGQFGTATVTVTVTDADNNSASDTLTVTVNRVNSAPTVSDIASVTVDEDQTATVAFTIGDDLTAPDDLVVTTTSGDTDLIPADNLVLGGSGADRTLAITPAENASGQTSVRITVSDGDFETREAFNVTVNPVNDAPIISLIAPVTIEENGTGTARFSIVDPEDDEVVVDVLTFDPDIIPESGLDLVNDGGGSYTLGITPAKNAGGTAQLRVSARDASRASRQDFTVTILASNDAPVISAIPDQTTGKDTPISIPFAVVDSDSTPADLVITALSFETGVVPNSGLSISEPQTGEFFSATLTGANERPNPVTSNGSGTGRLTLVGNTILVNVVYANLSSPITAAHIHGPASAEEAAGVLFGINDLHVGEMGGTSGQFYGTATINDATRDAILAGQTYFNIHSEQNGSGEIRGQIQPTGTPSFLYTLTATPAAGAAGTAGIRVQASDSAFGQPLTFRVSFDLNVIEVAPPLATLPIPDAPGTGLNGRYWKRPTASVLNILDRGGPNDVGLEIIKGGKADASFTATNIDYSGNDLTPLVEWLGADGASVAGNPNNLDDGVVSFTGWIAISEAGTVNFSTPSDDGSIVWIGDNRVIDNDGSHGAPGPAPDGSYDFAAPGLYPIEIAWFNSDWTDDAGNHGGASIQFTSDGAGGIGNAGGIVPAEKLYGSADIGLPLVAASGVNADAANNGAGLTGRYWQLPPASIVNLLDRGGDSDIGLKTMETSPPAGHFNATDLNYTGNDLTPVVDWLNSGGNNDGDSFSGFEGNLDDGLFNFDGYLWVDAGEHSFTSASDDGSIVWIGGVQVIDNDGSHGAPGPAPDGSAFFPVSGLYPISVAYFNADWTDDAGAHGGASINLTSNGEAISADRFYQADPAFTLTGADIGIEGDPVVPGSSNITQDTAFAYDVDVTAGGSDIWGADDSGHYVYTEWTGDFDASVEVTRLDVINQWSKAAIDVRESLDTGSRKLHVNVDSAAEEPVDGTGTGANVYEVGARVETDGNTSAWDAFGGDPIMNAADTTLPAWMRMIRQGNTFSALRSSDGVEWTLLSTIEQEFPATVFVALGTTSHNNDGPDFVTNAEYRNFTIFTPTTGEKEPPVLTIGIDDTGLLTIEWTSGTLQSAPSPVGPWTDVTVVPGRGQPAQPAESPFSEPANQPAKYYRVVD